jgi:hypothetical protein
MPKFDSLDELTPEIMSAYPVWYMDRRGGFSVESVTHRPVTDLACRIACVQVRLTNGFLIWANLANIDLEDRRRTDAFLSLSAYHRGKWFTLARHFDFEFATNGPDAFASFLGLPVEAVFPIVWDISAFCRGAVVSGTIASEPAERLSFEEAARLAAKMPGA